VTLPSAIEKMPSSNVTVWISVQSGTVASAVA
jgi:hypothetical protein